MTTALWRGHLGHGWLRSTSGLGLFEDSPPIGYMNELDQDLAPRAPINTLYRNINF